MFDFIPLVAVLCAAGGVSALILDIRMSRNPKTDPVVWNRREAQISPGIRDIVTEAIDALGIGLVGVITDMTPAIVEAWANGKGHPRSAEIDRLLAAHLSFRLISSAEGSDEVARHWFLSSDGPLEDGPISLLRSDQLDEVVRSARLQAMQ